MLSLLLPVQSLLLGEGGKRTIPYQLYPTMEQAKFYFINSNPFHNKWNQTKGKPLARFRNGKCVDLVLSSGLCGVLARTRLLCLVNVPTVKQESYCTLEGPWFTLLSSNRRYQPVPFFSLPLLLEPGAQLTCPVSLSMRFPTSSEYYADLSWILVCEVPDLC